MKKIVLFGMCLSVFIPLSAQNISPVKQGKIRASLANQGARTSIYTAGDNISVPAKSNDYHSGAKKNTTASTLVATPEYIGSTVYQLQTNASTRNALVKNADGTVSAVWTMSPADPATDRGTGYAYFNGTSWSAIPTTRIEASRTGWPSIGITGTGKEIVISHNTAASQLDLASRSAKGTGAWTESTSTLNGPSQGGNVWPRISVAGTNNDIIHVISLTSPTGLGGLPYNKQNGAMTYSRSQNSGTTWDKKNILLGADLDSANGGFNNFQGDGYALDAKGSTVAFVAGSATSDLVLMKSNDNGSTWAKTKILTFPFKNWNGALTDINNDGIADTLETNDGSMAIALDANNKAHVWYGRMRILNVSVNDSGSYTYFVYTSGLMYWNENMGASAPVMIADVVDADANGTFDMATNANGWSIGQYFSSLTSHPSGAIDANGTIYVAYDAVIEATADQTGTKSVRNIMVMASKDGGTTWSTPIKASDDPFNEQVYPSAAKLVNGCFSIMYQSDAAAGHGVNSGTTTNPDNAANLGISADIIYICVPVSDITGINENKTGSLIAASNYPNPFSGNTKIDITLHKSSNVSIDVYNTIGQKVLGTENKYMTAGTQTITIDASNLKPGIYFYTIRTNEASVTNKMIIQ